MAKNKALINQYKYIHRKAMDITPSVYASIAIPLVEKLGWTGDEVAQLFSWSQDEWNESINTSSRETMLDRCEKLTGIDLRNC